ncbi:adenylate/guanylate cyclase domain-containing protein [Thermomonas haemolytica]|uniref:Class 3 adenylate cyclase n=1 Tax=Thermomonas haemolytica TaxID=141949 RepID=A0A4R3NAA0_9GAMM|nr:adenylate/guanylate cyclase domain-containing protein [Thermomonas haemolytica]TCT25724.1 class 3 adenylate cyclase [Thermomonas haemolytica]TNY29729.1 adenylate/guanylate cyclase domain-containing protein [Thermomonas haemolytica]
MPLLDDMKTAVSDIARSAWATRQGQVVPDPEDLRLGNDAVEFDRATVLYADLQGSTSMVDAENWQLSAEVYKTFLYCAASIIRKEGGKITSYDGDRVMGIWVGDRQTTPAAIAGLKINYAVQQIVNPALRQQYPRWTGEVKQVVGIDTSAIRAARTGVRGGNDIVWVGRAANYAAKLTDLNLNERTWVTDEAFKRLADEAKLGGSPRQSMWKRYSWSQQGDRIIHGSTWWWAV